MNTKTLCTNKIIFHVKSFNELTTHELYDLLHLRSTIFMFEQDIILPDLDYKDQIALHVLGKLNNKLVAYSRVFKPNDCYSQASFGRVVVDKQFRRKRFGHIMMQFVINVIKEKFNTDTIKISAQTYLQKFYEYYGFKVISEEHLEDKTPHIYMLKQGVN